mgnify:FL=1
MQQGEADLTSASIWSNYIYEASQRSNGEFKPILCKTGPILHISPEA